MKKIFAFTAIFLSCFFLLSCSSSYIGRPVRLNHHDVCTFDSLPAKCTYTSQHFVIKYDIAATENTNEYNITGSAVDLGGGTKAFTDYSNANFTLLLVAQGVVIETVNIAGGRGSLGKPIIFSRSFKTQNGFQATLITYDMAVRG